MTKEPMDDGFPEIVPDAPKPRRGVFAKLGGLFRRKPGSDAFGRVETPPTPEDPFGVGDAEQDARFRRQRRLMAAAMILLLVGGGGVAAYIRFAPPPQPKATPMPDGGGRIVQTMPPETGPENLNNALIRPPMADNPDAARRMGALAPDAAPATAAPAPAQPAPAPTPPAPPAATAQPQPPAAAPAPPPAPIPAADEPKSPAARADRDQASRPPRFADLAKPAAAAVQMPKAPLSEMQQRTPAGLVVPMVAPDGRRPWQAYARPFAPQARAPRVAVVVRGLGLAAEATAAAIDLMPSETTLAFDANAPRLPERLAAARRAGHETLLEIGLENPAFPAVDPGPDGLVSSLPVEENERRLERLMARGDVYVGILAQGGERYAASAPHFAALAQNLKRRGVAFVAPNAAAPFETLEIRPARAYADIRIDDAAFREQIAARLRQAETVARSRGGVVVVADASPLALSMISPWMGGLPAKGLQAAPVSAVVKE